MLPFGVLCLFLSITETSNANRSEGLTCETDYWLTIDCFLSSKAIPNRTERTSYWLEFGLKGTATKIKEEKIEKVFNCSLIAKEDGYACRFQALGLPFQDSFTDFNAFAIKLCYLENSLIKSTKLDDEFSPSKHIKPIKPHNITLDTVEGYYIFKWTSGYEKHEYYKVLSLQYTFIYRKEGHPNKSLTLFQTTKNNISENNLDPGSQYSAWVCTEILTNSKYNGAGNSCSSAIMWNTSHTVSSVEDPTAALVHFTPGFVFLICLVAAALFFRLYPVARMKIKEVTWVATPSLFFQSLYQNHQGNFKAWVSEGEVGKTYTEEISKIDSITEITAEEQGQQKISSMYLCPSTQYHTPYVGPSAEAWIPFQLSKTRSVCSVSCKDLNFLAAEEPAAEEPVLCLTMFQPITVQGFLSMDDLEFSQEDLEPPEPRSITPKPAGFPQNYCTLTNTSTGLIPTFATGPCNPEPPADGHASEEPLKMEAEENTTELVALTLDSLQLCMEE